MQLKNLSDISNQYDGILSDIWGVVHNGLRANRLAVDALIKYRSSGGRVILITNASRTKPYIKKMLEGMNISSDAYDDIVTSGDVTREIVAKYKGQNIHHVGPSKDNPIFDGLGVRKSLASEAKVVVVTGLNDDRETPDDYVERLNEWLALKLPMICTNPDAIVEIGDEMVYCAGSIADKYLQMGGVVLQAGKPYQPIYDASFLAFEKASRNALKEKKILAIGDSVRTDAKGAANNDLDLLFITGSIHAHEINGSFQDEKKEVVDLLAPSGANMVAYQDGLK
jgi:HAD superfamily hydrolase (TIGR01459 family)